MTSRLWELFLFVIAAACAILTIVGWRAVQRAPERAASSVPSAEPTWPGATGSSSEGAGPRIAQRDPFRFDRRPAQIVFDPEQSPAQVPGDQPPPPRAAPILVGIAGPPWQAILEGMPGREGGVVLRQGDAFSDFRVSSIQRDTVVLDTSDTTYVLTVRAPWP